MLILNGIYIYSKDSLCVIYYIIFISKYKIDIIFFFNNKILIIMLMNYDYDFYM